MAEGIRLLKKINNVARNFIPWTDGTDVLENIFDMIESGGKNLILHGRNLKDGTLWRVVQKVTSHFLAFLK